jgi:hypothetical protein
MINVQMTVREIAWLIAQCGGYQCELYGRAVEALVGACEKTGTNVTVKSVPQDNFISAIRIIRNYTRWGLKDTKDFLDVVRGPWLSTGSYAGGRPNTLTVTFGRDAIALAEELRGIGCVVRVGDT